MLEIVHYILFAIANERERERGQESHDNYAQVSTTTEEQNGKGEH